MRWELRECLRNPALWGPLLFLVAYSAGPGYDDSLYFFYINRCALGFLPKIGRNEPFRASCRLETRQTTPPDAFNPRFCTQKNAFKRKWM